MVNLRLNHNPTLVHIMVLRPSTHFLLVCLLILSALKSMSQDFESARVVRSASSTLMENVFEAAGLEYSSLEHNVYFFTIKGYKAFVQVNNDSIMVSAVFSGRRISLNRINDWNEKSRFCRAYLDDDGEAVLEADLDFGGGVTGETIVRFLATFAHNLEQFSQHL